VLFAFFLKELLETVWSEVVEEFDNIILFAIRSSSDMEVDTNTKRNMDIVLGWDVVNRAFKSNSVLRNLSGDMTAEAHAPLGTRLSQS
jgi:hypothetical protein